MVADFPAPSGTEIAWRFVEKGLWVAVEVGVSLAEARVYWVEGQRWRCHRDDGQVALRNEVAEEAPASLVTVCLDLRRDT